MTSCLDTIVALDGASGGLLWSQEMGPSSCDTLTHHSSPSVGPGGAFVVVGSNSNSVNAYDAETGALLWLTVVESYVWATPVVDASGKVFILVTGGPLLVLDGATGEEIAEYVILSSVTAIAIPAIALNPATGAVTVFISGGDSFMHAFSGGACEPGNPCVCFAGAEPTPDGSDCSPCPAGFYNAVPGRPCLPCAPDSFASSVGSRGCTACPPGYESPAAAAACSTKNGPSASAMVGITAGTVLGVVLLVGAAL
jgi:hypothetical protein